MHRLNIVDRADLLPNAGPGVMSGDGMAESCGPHVRARKLGGGSVREAAMRPGVVVVDPPGFDGLASIGQADEPALVQAFVAEPPVEAFDVGVLHGLARLNEGERDAAGVCPLVERAPGELGAIVHHDRLRQSADAGQPIERSDDPCAGQREVHLERGALPRVVIDDRQRAEPPPVGERVAHEVHAPALVRAGGRGERCAWPGDTLPPPPPHDEPRLTLQAVNELPIDQEPFTAQQHVESPVAPARAQLGQGRQPSAQRGAPKARRSPSHP